MFCPLRCLAYRYIFVSEKKKVTQLKSLALQWTIECQTQLSNEQLALQWIIPLSIDNFQLVDGQYNSSEQWTRSLSFIAVAYRVLVLNSLLYKCPSVLDDKNKNQLTDKKHDY